MLNHTFLKSGISYKKLFFTQHRHILDFKLSLCSVLTLLTFGCFPSVWFILADVSERFSHFKPLKMDLTEGSETSANINQMLGKHPKVNTDIIELCGFCLKYCVFSEIKISLVP
jgi:hypothetical protein